MTLHQLNVLAEKAIHGYRSGNLTKNGMRLTTAEYLLLNRLRQSEADHSPCREISLFFYICWQVWNVYYEECMLILQRNHTAITPKGDEFNVEMIKINKHIVMCLVLYAMHQAGNNDSEKDIYFHNAYRIYKAKNACDRAMIQK